MMRCSWGWKKETLEASGKLDQLYNLVPDFFRPEKPGVYTYPLNGDTSQDCVLSPLLPHSAHTPPAQSHPPILYVLCLLALLLCHTQHSKHTANLCLVISTWMTIESQTQQSKLSWLTSSLAILCFCIFSCSHDISK